MNDRIYQDEILARAKDAAREGRLAAPAATATRDNPLCGDRVTLDFALDGGRIASVRHFVRGCALCRASAATLAAVLEGKTAAALDDAAAALDGVLAGGDGDAGVWRAFAPVGRHKSRHDCVRLPLAAARDALGA